MDNIKIVILNQSSKNFLRLRNLKRDKSMITSTNIDSLLRMNLVIFKHFMIRLRLFKEELVICYLSLLELKAVDLNSARKSLRH